MKSIIIFFLISIMFFSCYINRKANKNYNTCDFSKPQITLNDNWGIIKIKVFSVLIFDKSTKLHGFYKGVLEDSPRDTCLFFDFSWKDKNFDFSRLFLSDFNAIYDFRKYSNDSCINYKLPKNFMEKQMKYYPSYKLVFGTLLTYEKL